jgi:cysteine desulfurase/selenocysteine lyase
MSAYDVRRIREDFPILSREIRPGVPLVYLDSTATSQKPRAVLDAMDAFYRRYHANIHRGIYVLSEESTEMYEAARASVAQFIGAASPREIIFTRNATESINLVAQTWGRANLHEGDTILLTEMEHHSNLVPWQILAAEKNLHIEFVPVTDEGLLDMTAYASLLEKSPKLVAFAHMSNVLGTIPPAQEMIRMAHEAGAVVLLDGAQSVPHFNVDVRALDADFLAFSSHKMLGPSGIGALYGKESLLESMPPFLGGGSMIRNVTLRGFTTEELPHKFEAGTPAIAEAIGFGAAVAYLSNIGMTVLHEYERELTAYALERLEETPGVRVLGPSAEHRGGLAAFTLKGVHPHDVAQILDEKGIAVRAGKHCAHPLHERFGVPATTRASFYLYNTREEIDKLIEGLYYVRKTFA